MRHYRFGHKLISPGDKLLAANLYVLLFKVFKINLDDVSNILNNIYPTLKRFHNSTKVWARPLPFHPFRSSHEVLNVSNYLRDISRIYLMPRYIKFIPWIHDMLMYNRNTSSRDLIPRYSQEFCVARRYFARLPWPRSKRAFLFKRTINAIYFINFSRLCFVILDPTWNGKLLQSNGRVSILEILNALANICFWR